MKSKSKIGECSYCGVVAEMEKEDVIPRCLFPKPRPDNLVKIPSCRKCNLEKSKDDDYLRDFLVADFAVANHPIAQQLFQDKLLSSARQNSSSLAKAAVNQGKNTAVYTKAGIYLGDGYTVPLDEQRVNIIFERIVRGLYFKAKNQRMPDNYSFDVKKIDMLAFQEAFPKMQELGFNGPHKIGQDVFTCIWMYADTDPFITVWWLFFYDSLGVYVASKK